MVRVKIIFSGELAKEIAESAKEWRPNKKLVWEAEEFNIKNRIKLTKDGRLEIKTKKIEIELKREELEKIKELLKE